MASTDTAAAAFAPADAFDGARDGYVFKAGDQGVGYYADAAPRAAAAPAAAVVLSVTVPDGAEPGDVLQVLHPHTEAWVDVEIPAGAAVGSTFQVAHAAPAAAAVAAAAADADADADAADAGQEEVIIQQEIGKQVGAGGAAIQVVEDSLCVQCGGTGVTHLLPTVIPYFKEIIVCHFKCGDCGWQNTETMETSKIQAKGTKITFAATAREDLNRRVIKSQHATIDVVELGLTLPSMTQRGTMTTVEGVLMKTVEHLRQDQPARREQHPELAAKLDDFISRLVLFATGLELPFTIVLDDPTGNSHIENPSAPAVDPNMKTSYYVRTKPQNIMVGLGPNAGASSPAAASSNGDGYAEIGGGSGGGGGGNGSGGGGESKSDPAVMQKVRDKSNAKREGWIEFDRKADFTDDVVAEKKVVEIPMDCPACGMEGGAMRSMQTNIPHFKDVVIMAYTCERCGFKTNEIKAGGGVPEKGCKWTLRCSGTKPEDMHRDVLKSNTARVTIEELGFEMEPGSLGGLYTTVEGLLNQIHDRLKGSNPFAYGDAAEPGQKSNFARFLDKITTMRTGLEPFTLVIQDPMDNSFIYSPATDGFVDDELTREMYTRTEEENEEMGLNDMVTDGYFPGQGEGEGREGGTEGVAAKTDE